MDRSNEPNFGSGRRFLFNARRSTSLRSAHPRNFLPNEFVTENVAQHLAR